MKAEASIYIPQEQTIEESIDKKAVERTKGGLLEAFKKHKNMLNFDLKTMCKNITLQGKTELVQRYAVGAISKIVNNEPITSRSMLDALFNTYAPAFNATLEKSGYNSIMAMKDAAFNGTINPANFLSAFNSGLIAVQEENDFNTRLSQYGDEIPIDLVETFKNKYELETAAHETSTRAQFIDYIKDHSSVKIIVDCHVKNENAEIWSAADFLNKLVDAMLQKKPVVFRIGKSIYENVIIKEYNPTITNIYDLSFELVLEYNYLFARESKLTSNGMRIINGQGNQEIMNILADPEYIGEGLVEEVTERDSTIQKALDQVLGVDYDQTQGL